jgi:hypothetical protein
MRRVLLPAVLLLVIAGDEPRPRDVIVDQALVDHLRTLEDWARQFELTEGIPLPAIAQWESSPPELFPAVLELCAPFYSEFDSLWDDPLSRAHLRCGLLFRPDNPRIMGTRECLNLLVARAIYEGRENGDRDACQRNCEQALAYAHSLGTDDIGFMLGWMGEGIVASALQKVACERGAPGASIGNQLGTMDVPYGIQRLIPDAREQYERKSQETRELLAFAAR